MIVYIVYSVVLVVETSEGTNVEFATRKIFPLEMVIIINLLKDDTVKRAGQH